MIVTKSTTKQELSVKVFSSTEHDKQQQQHSNVKAINADGEIGMI